MFRFGAFFTLKTHSLSHQFLITAFDVRLLVLLIVSGPAVGDKVADDGRVVGDLGPRPSHHQGGSIQGLNLHVDWSTAAGCREIQTQAFSFDYDTDVYLVLWMTNRQRGDVRQKSDRIVRDSDHIEKKNAL